MKKLLMIVIGLWISLGAVAQDRSPMFTVKTNLLYDLATAWNVEVEAPIGDKYSVMVENICPWWTWGKRANKYALQLLEMGVEPRWWFKSEERLMGHFAGAYLMSAKFDIQNDRDLCYQGTFWSAGFTYGYVRPLFHEARLELSVSLGFLRADYRHYQPGENYEGLYLDKYNSGIFNYFGPTKLKVSLVLPIYKDRIKKRMK